MKVIVGTAGTGKTFILAQEALESSKEKKVLIYASNPKDIFMKLGIVAGNDKIVGITVVKVKDTSDVIKHLLLNAQSYDEVYVDTDDIAKDNTSFYKLQGYALGSGIDLTITWQTNLNGDSGRVTLYVSSPMVESLSKLRDWTRKEISEKIKEWKLEL